jgi:hypothetical protein
MVAAKSALRNELSTAEDTEDTEKIQDFSASSVSSVVERLIVQRAPRRIRESLAIGLPIQFPAARMGNDEQGGAALAIGGLLLDLSRVSGRFDKSPQPGSLFKAIAPSGPNFRRHVWHEISQWHSRFVRSVTLCHLKSRY